MHLLKLKSEGLLKVVDGEHMTLEDLLGNTRQQEEVTLVIEEKQILEDGIKKNG